MSRVGRRLLGVGALLFASAACSSGDVEGGPIVGRIDDAIAAVERSYGAPQDYFEISATEEVVSVVVAADEASVAEQVFWTPDAGMADPVELGAMDRPTFRSADVDVDPDAVLDGIRAELPESEIVDFAITATADGVVVYDARVQSSQGGVLLVLLARDGRILGVQAE